MPLGSLGQLRVVQVYKHLGTSVLASGKQTAEWASRANLSNAMTGAMAKALFKGDTFSLASRSTVATASVHSRLLFAAGTWELPPKASFAKLRKAYMRPFRHMVHQTWTPANDDPHTSDRVCSKLGVPIFGDVLCAHRLRFLARLQHAPQCLISLLKSNAGNKWRAQIQNN